MILEMLYSTYGDRVHELVDNLPPTNSNLKILIVHQVNSVNESAAHLFSHRSDVKYLFMLDKGVTKSRNLAIENATGDIILFCDDDVLYDKDFLSNISSQYKKNPNLGSITFSYQTPSKGVLPKFKNKSFTHNLRSILSVGTIEISCKLSELRRARASFPENLGAGSYYYCCDEPVFLSRLIKNGVLVEYIPLCIGSHPDISSGIELNSYRALFSRLVSFRYIYGYFLGTLIFNVFCFKKIRLISFKLLFFSFFSIFFVRLV